MIGINYGNSGSVFVELLTSGLKGVLKNGKSVTIISLNDVNNDLFIYNTVRGSSAVRVGGGGTATLRYLEGYWYITGTHNNDW